MRLYSCCPCTAIAFPGAAHRHWRFIVQTVLSLAVYEICTAKEKIHVIISCKKLLGKPVCHRLMHTDNAAVAHIAAWNCSAAVNVPDCCVSHRLGKTCCSSTACHPLTAASTALCMSAWCEKMRNFSSASSRTPTCSATALLCRRMQVMSMSARTLLDGTTKALHVACKRGWADLCLQTNLQQHWSKDRRPRITKRYSSISLGTCYFALVQVWWLQCMTT